MSFEDIYNIANKYFHLHVALHGSFTHNVDDEVANFWLY